MQKLDKSKLVRGLSKGEKLAPYLDKVLRNFDEPFEFVYSPKGVDDAWHPSGHCTPSVVELYEMANNHLDATEALEEGDAEVVPEILSPSLRKSFLVGHYWHQLIQYIILNKLGFCEAEDVECKGSQVWGKESFLNIDEGFLSGEAFHWATGSGDVVPLVLPSGWMGVMDIKSMSSRTFAQTACPFADKYECQVNIYMDFFEMEKAMILGVNKDTPHDFKEFYFERNQPLIDAIYEKWMIVSDALDAGSPPEDVQIDLPLIGPVKA
jgi:hypothetical protein